MERKATRDKMDTRSPSAPSRLARRYNESSKPNTSTASRATTTKRRRRRLRMSPSSCWHKKKVPVSEPASTESCA